MGMAYKKPKAFEARRVAIARRIKSRQDDLGIKSQDIAKKLYIHRDTWGNWSSGRLSVPADMMPEIARLLDTSVDFFYGIPQQHVRRAA